MYFDPSEDYMGYMFAGDYCVTAMHVHCNVSFKFLVICRFVYVLIITVIHYGIITQNIFEVLFFCQMDAKIQNVIQVYTNEWSDKLFWVSLHVQLFAGIPRQLNLRCLNSQSSNYLVDNSIDCENFD